MPNYTQIQINIKNRKGVEELCLGFVALKEEQVEPAGSRRPGFNPITILDASTGLQILLYSHYKTESKLHYMHEII